MKGRLAAAAALILLGGCDTTRDEGTVTVTGMLRERVAAIGQPEPEPAPLPSRAVLEARTDPLLLVEIPSRGARATVTPAARNAGAITWLSADGITVTSRDGVIVATRGLGWDLMSADVSEVLAALPQGGAATRLHYTLDTENRTVLRRYACRLAPAGRDTVEIVGRRFPSRVVDETCAGADGRFANRYWIANGRIVQSRQHLTPQIGAVTTRLLAD